MTDLPLRILTEWPTSSFQAYIGTLKAGLAELSAAARTPVAAGGRGTGAIQSDFRSLQATTEATVQAFETAGAPPRAVAGIRKMAERMFNEALGDINSLRPRKIIPLVSNGPADRNLEVAADNAREAQKKADESRERENARVDARRARANRPASESPDSNEAAHAQALTEDRRRSAAAQRVLDTAHGQAITEENRRQRAAEREQAGRDAAAKRAFNASPEGQTVSNLDAADLANQRSKSKDYLDSTALLSTEQNRLKEAISKALTDWPEYAQSVTELTVAQNREKAALADSNVLSDEYAKSESEAAAALNRQKAAIAEANAANPHYIESVAAVTKANNDARARIAEANASPARLGSAVDAKLAEQRLATATKAGVLAGRTTEDIGAEASNIAQERLQNELRRLEVSRSLLSEDGGEIELIALRKANENALNALIKERVAVEQKRINAERVAGGQSPLDFGGPSDPKAPRRAGALGAILGGGTLGETIATGAIFGAGFRLQSEIRSAVDEALKLNQQFALLQQQAKAIGQGDNFGEFRDEIIDIAKSTGVASTDVATLAGEFLGLYGNTAQAVVATSDASKLLLAIGGDAKTAGPQIAALAEDLGASVEQIGNTVLDLSDKTGRAGTDMLNALGQVAPVANELNLTLDQTRGLIEAVSVGSSKSGQAIGEGLARVLPELQKNLPKIEELGIKVSPEAAAGNGAAAIRDLLTGYNQLSQARKELVTSQLGGPRNAQVLASAFQNTPAALAAFNSQLGDNNRLNDAAAAAQDTLKGSLDKLHESFVGLAQTLANTGIIDFFTGLVQLATRLANAFDGLPGKIAAVALALKGLQLASGLLGLGGAGAAAEGAAAGASGGILARLGGLFGAQAGGHFAEGAGEALLSGSVAPLAITGVVAYTGEKQWEKQFKARRAALLAQYEKESDVQLERRLKDPEFITQGTSENADRNQGQNIIAEFFAKKLFHRGSKTYDTNKKLVESAIAGHKVDSIEDQLNALLSANLFTPEDNKAIQADLAKGNDPKAVADLLKRYQSVADSPQGKQAIATAGEAKLRSDAISKAVNSTTDTVQTLDDALTLFQQGDISYDQYIAALQEEIDRLAKYPNPDDQKTRNKDIVQLAKTRSDELSKNVQSQIDSATAAGTLTDQQLVDIYKNALAQRTPGATQAEFDKFAALRKNLAVHGEDLSEGGSRPDTVAHPTLTAEQTAAFQKNEAAAQAKLRQDTLTANAALLKAQAGRDPLKQALADQTSAGKELDDIKSRVGTNDPQYKQALAAKLNADETVVSAQDDIAKARIALLQAQDANDPLKAAKDAQSAANLAIQQAHGDAARIQAEAQKVQADRSFTDATNAITLAKINLLKAQHTSQDNPVAAAQDQIDLVKEQIREAIAGGADPNGAQILDLKGQQAQAEHDKNTAQIAETERQIQVDQDLRRITTGGAIARLQALRLVEASSGATQTQLDGIDQQIRSLQKQSSADFQFDLPSQINLPTLYQARLFNQNGTSGYQDNRTITFGSNAIVIQKDMTDSQVRAIFAEAMNGPTQVFATARRV